jgi:hypothetical protein
MARVLASTIISACYSSSPAACRAGGASASRGLPALLVEVDLVDRAVFGDELKPLPDDHEHLMLVWEL